MVIRIRPFTSVDYAAVVNIFPNHITEHVLRAEYQSRDPKCKYGQWIAEENKRIVAYGSYEQQSEMYNPQEFMVSHVIIHPEYQNQKLQVPLYERLLADLHQYKPDALRILVPSMDTVSLNFLFEKGFQEDNDLCLLQMRLDVTAFDFQQFSDQEDKVKEQGLVIKRLTDLSADPDWDRKLYALFYELRKGLPHHTTLAPFSYFMKRRVKWPLIVPDAYYIAVHDDEYIGLSYMEMLDPTTLYIKFTGVKASYQGKGIGLLLKLQGITYAKDHNYKAIITTCNTVNERIAALNVKLGFIRQPAFDTMMLVKGLKKMGKK